MTQLKTLTYKVVVDTGGAKKDAKTFRTTLTAMGESGQDVDSKMQQLANTLGKEYNQKITVARDQTKSQRIELQRMARETSRTEKAVDRLTREYQSMTAGLGKGADEQQILNAQMRLGANATQVQKDSVRQLVSNYQKLRNETNKTQGSMRGFRGQMGNVGFQLQDVAVQAQMGTNAMVIIGQQGSQLAGGFGPTGALIGAVIAFGAMLVNVLSPSMFDSGEKIEQLVEKLEKLKRTVGLTQDQANLLSRQKEEEIKTSQSAIKTLDEELKIKQLAMDRQKKKLELDGLTFASMNKENSGYKGTLAALAQTKKAYDELTVSVSDINAKRKTEQQTIEGLNDDIKTYDAAVGNIGSTTLDKWKDSNERIVKSLKDKAVVLDLSVVQLIEYERTQKLAQLATQNANDTQVAEVQTYYAMIIASAQANEQIKEQNSLKTEQARINREAVKLNKDLATQWQKQQSDMVKQLSVIENVKKRIGVGDLRRLESQYETEKSLLAGQTDALLKLDEEYQKNKLKLNGTSLQKYMISLEESVSAFDEVATASITNFTKGFGRAVGDAVFESDNLGDAMKGIFKDVGKNMVAFFAEWAAQELIIWGLKKTLGSATQIAAATTMTANASAQVLMAGLNAFASTAAIPIVGPFAAPAAAAAAVAYTTPMATALSGIAFAGALDKGGTIPQDAIGIMSEYRDELANGVLVRGGQGGTQVTSSDETARLMKGGRGGDTYNITANGNVTADQITRAIIRRAKGKGSKAFDDAVYDAGERGQRNKGRRYARN